MHSFRTLHIIKDSSFGHLFSKHLSDVVFKFCIHTQQVGLWVTLLLAFFPAEKVKRKEDYEHETFPSITEWVDQLNDRRSCVTFVTFVLTPRDDLLPVETKTEHAQCHTRTL